MREIKNMFKRAIIIIAIIVSVCLIIGLVSIHSQINSSDVLSLLSQDPPSEFYIYSQTDGYPNEVIFSDNDIILEIHNIVKSKTAKRQYEQPDKDKIVLVIDYGYKGDTISIDTNGRIFISEDSGSIRNKSRLHWLWWKLDGWLISKGRVHLTYATEPDAKVLKLVKTIRNYVEGNWGEM